ncbi:sulfotransferase 1A1-like isoform X2 [Patiria miniata]|uniref:Sulfotransferase domain-containing protein n=1 Tax=Patiria miniata TaxID=46514 RepID=A0A914AMD5_PATMI|nr:sulfotransferase 1A1-like isoform X2 [Patiria miniata]XP_038065190.1 sulfotransferase 1A1-like isoform X2 [Patiria miniata]
MEKYVTFEEYRELFQKMQAMIAPADFKPPPNGEVDGIVLPPGMDEVVRDLKDFEVREDDAWIVTYPKAGTTWAQEIMSCVMHDGNLEEVNKRHTTFRVPFLELNLPEPIRRMKNMPHTHKIVAEMPSPRVIKSHLPGQLLPPQLWTKKPKIVYVMRNPKDVVVSTFHFMRMMDRSPTKQAETFAEFLENMLDEKCIFGTWWDHYLYFWRKRHEPNILVLQFEDMKRDLRGIVEQTSQFLGKNFSAETLDAITEHCTFANMKKNPMANQDSVFALPVDEKTGDKASFMRKGKVGDWRSHFTVAQNEVMDAKTKEKLHGTGLTFDY